MAGNKIRTFLQILEGGATMEAAIAASGVSLNTAKIQMRKAGLTKPAPKKEKKVAAPKVLNEDGEEVLEI